MLGCTVSVYIGVGVEGSGELVGVTIPKGVAVWLGFDSGVVDITGVLEGVSSGVDWASVGVLVPTLVAVLVLVPDEFSVAVFTRLGTTVRLFVAVGIEAVRAKVGVFVEVG